MNLGKLFFETYATKLGVVDVVDIGAQNVNGSLKEVSTANCRYIGVDFVPGKGVDVILTDPYTLPFADSSIDIIVSSSCFEHSEFFWVLFMEMMRALKPGGLCYINAPSNGPFHQYPVDCWRFYPDSGRALAAWAQRNNIDAVHLESFINQQAGPPKDSVWNDTVMVFLKGREHLTKFPDRMIDKKTDFFNGYRDSSPQPINFSLHSEDRLKSMILVQKINAFLGELQGQQGNTTESVNDRFTKLASSVNKFIASLQAPS